MIPAPVQALLEEHVEDGAMVATTVLLAVVAVFAAKFLVRGIGTASAAAGIRRLFRR